MPLILILYFIFSSLLFLLPNVLEIIAAVKYRLKNSSYFCYFIVQSIVRLISYFFYNTLWRLTLYPEYNRMFITMDQDTGKWINAPLLYLGVVHEFIMAFIAIDRLCALVLGLQHKFYWKRLFYFAIIASFGLAFLVTWQTFFRGVAFFELNSTGVIISDLVEGGPEIKLSVNMSAALLANTIISSVCYAVSYIYFKKKWKNNISSANHEMKFLWLGLFGFISTLPLTIHQLMFTYTSFAGIRWAEEPLVFMFQLLPWLVDLKYFAVVYIVIGMNKSFRNECIETVKFALNCFLPIALRLSNNNSIHITPMASPATNRLTPSQLTTETTTNH